jgi:hypothetical protein
MRSALAIVALLVVANVTSTAQGGSGASGASGAGGAARGWHVDIGGAILPEAWEPNESREWFTGAIAGVDRRLWRGLAVRGEALLLRVTQPAEDAWLRGWTVGARTRWHRRTARPVIDIAVGTAEATRRIPPRGTRFNYLAVIGAGVEMPFRQRLVSVTGRWLHASNNGREGRHRNPDIQSLGVVIGVVWGE